MRWMVLVLFWVWPGMASADGVLPGPIPADVVRVVDGDTVAVLARIWPGQTVETHVRLAGIDTPELRGSGCPAERALAEAARDRLEGLLGAGPVYLRDVALGTFAGRVVARIETPAGVDVAGPLVTDGLARVYDGGHRAAWCE